MFFKSKYGRIDWFVLKFFNFVWIHWNCHTNEILYITTRTWVEESSSTSLNFLVKTITKVLKLSTLCTDLPPYDNLILNQFSSLFFFGSDAFYTSFDYPAALLNYKASRESELDYHVMSFWLHYWLRVPKILWLSPNPCDKIQNGGIFDCTPDHMVLHGMPRYYIVFETAIVYSEVSKFQLHPNSRPCDHSSISSSVSRPIPVLTLSGTFRGGRMNR